MPHYADGTEAKVGDQVTGKLYNTPGVRAGTIISITPGAESCNAQVQFTVACPVPPVGHVAKEDTRMSLGVPRTVHSEQHGTAGPEVSLHTCVDYCATSELTKVGP